MGRRQGGSFRFLDLEETRIHVVNIKLLEVFKITEVEKITFDTKVLQSIFRSLVSANAEKCSQSPGTRVISAGQSLQQLMCVKCRPILAHFDYKISTTKRQVQPYPVQVHSFLATRRGTAHPISGYRKATFEV